MAGAGDTTKGAEALKGVSIPMFSAKGLAIKRANGEVVTPFYFAYEDLREDWGKLVEQAEAASADGSEDGEKSKSVAKKLAAKPKVENRINCLHSHSTVYSPLTSFSLADQLKIFNLFINSDLVPIPSPSISYLISPFHFYTFLLRLYLSGGGERFRRGNVPISGFEC